jgi:hypothetical protein
MIRRTLVLVFLASSLAACKKDGAKGTAEAGAVAIASVGTAGFAAPKASSSAAPAASAAGTASTFHVSYTITAGSLYIPSNKDWSSAKFKNDEARYLGDGSLTLNVGADGRVSGTSEGGPLGAAVVDGLVENGTLAATIRRKDPSDEGLTGTLFAKISGASLEGSMKLAEGKAAVVREAKVTSAKGS